RSIKEARAVEEGVAVQAAQPRELRVLQAGDGAEQAHLLAVLQLGLEADDVPQRAERIVLAQLHHRPRPLAGARIAQADRLHRAEAQALWPGRGDHLDRLAALEVG